METLSSLTPQSSSFFFFGLGVSRISECAWHYREFCLFLWFPGLESGTSVLLRLGDRQLLVLNGDPGKIAGLL